ncbi:MAG: NirD/YgiW/YdeI family stress tolerance protein [Coriobacteriales bacterium]|nr:NirD/YgiW/YdeI family stress tolerance protein [Coriobacteriales bacterium]
MHRDSKRRFAIAGVLAAVVLACAAALLAGCAQQQGTAPQTQQPAEPTASLTPTPTAETTATTQTPTVEVEDTVKAILDGPVEGQTVTLAGTIVRVEDEGEYLFSDETGQLRLEDAKNLPAQEQGTKVIVMGKVDPGDGRVKIRVTELERQ